MLPILGHLEFPLVLEIWHCRMRGVAEIERALLVLSID
jgi:hypothetical protein